MNRKRLHPMRRQRAGVALIYVLLVAGLLGVVSVSLLHSQRDFLTLARTREYQRISACAAQGAAHRGLALLRRDKNLRGNVLAVGPEAGLGVVSSVTITSRADGQLLISASSTYHGSVAKTQIVVGLARL